jgi:hypothetical protein
VGRVSYHGETGEDTRRNPRMEPGSGKRRSLWTASSRKTGPKWVWKRLVELSTMSLGSTTGQEVRSPGLNERKKFGQYTEKCGKTESGIQADPRRGVETKRRMAQR